MIVDSGLAQTLNGILIEESWFGDGKDEANSLIKPYKSDAENTIIEIN